MSETSDRDADVNFHDADRRRVLGGLALGAGAGVLSAIAAPSSAETAPASGSSIQAANLTEDQIGRLLDQMADSFQRQLRSPIVHLPSELGLIYEEVTFPSLDGVPLEGWFIPAEGSNRIIIANHPMGFSRSGIPAHLEPWRSIWRASGNDIEVDFIPDYKILHDAGYNVLTYDLRNFGHSGEANGGIASSGIFEARDVLGSLNYVRGRDDLRGMIIGLFSRCLGCSSTFRAMADNPAAFEGVRCLVGPQPSR